MHFFLQQKLSSFINKKTWFWLFCCSCSILVSQTFYSTDPAYLRSKSENNNLLSTYHYSYPDTTINNLHNYFPRNFLGNLGLASPTYLLNYGSNNLGFNLNPSPYQNDSYSENQVEYFRSKGPYANLTGIAGSKKMQAFKMLFTSTYKDKVNITLKFSRYTSLGYYSKQQTYTNNFYMSSNYATKNTRFGYYAYILANGNKNRENGGIKDDTLSEKTLAQHKEVLLVKLNGAIRDNRDFRATINPYFKLNKSSDSNKVNHFIQLKSSIITNALKYTDENISSDKFYTLMYLDTVRTHDSTHVKKLINEINYAAVTTNSNFALSFGYKNEINQVWQLADSLFHNHIATADLAFRKAFTNNDSSGIKQKEFKTHFNFQYIFDGANKGNYKVENRSVLMLNRSKQRSLYFNILAEERSADYIYNNWVSNHFWWYNNGYKPQQQVQATLGCILNKNISASVFIQNINNYLYFDNVALPNQYAKPITNMGLTVDVTKVFFKHLGLSLNYKLQNTSNETYVRLPKNQVIAKLFYTGWLFKNNLNLQIGSQLQMYQSFYAYNYMPSTQAFYLQENFKTTPYPFVDVYLNARIRPVAFFLKVENALFGFAGTNYALTPGYFQTDRAFRLGISWTFFD